MCVFRTLEDPGALQELGVATLEWIGKLKNAYSLINSDTNSVHRNFFFLYRPRHTIGRHCLLLRAAISLQASYLV